MSRIVFLAIVVGLFPLIAIAEPVPFTIYGNVDKVLQPAPAPFETTKVGDPFQINFTLEDSTSDQNPGENFGTFSGAHLAYEVIINGVSANTVLGGVNTVNASSLAPEDSYAAVGVFEDFSTSVSFTDATGNAIGPNDDLSTIDLSGFTHRKFMLFTGQDPVLTGFVIVPESNSVSLVFAAVLLSLAQSRALRSHRTSTVAAG